ncbi:MAG: MBOAT family protein [Spirochaetes bacterium]|nr:MBOAT family protein [Spirochaetota bacterium]
MFFNSPEFLLFFTVVTIAFFALPHRFRWIMLLAASYFFYMCWNASYGLLILFTTVVVYASAVLIEKRSKGQKQLILAAAVLLCLGVLFIFKYYNFFAHSVQGFFDLVHVDKRMPLLQFILPAGISFYTFQSIGYVVDVYRGNRKPERHFGILALYVSFFPQLVAGPIERSTYLLPQFRKRMTFDYDRVTDGLKLMAWGFFKKLVVADRLALYVDRVHINPMQYEGLPLILATTFFAWQIYCDFSAYSDIAIGSSQVLGYDLMDNFNRPFHAKTINEFWSRWHISLITWLRDYLYIPLGGNRVSRFRWYVNIMIVFTLSGLWHGARWTFVLWGALNGVFIIISHLTIKRRLAVKDWLFRGIERIPAALHALAGAAAVAAAVYGAGSHFSIQAGIILGAAGCFLLFLGFARTRSFFPRVIEGMKGFIAVFITVSLFILGAVFFRSQSLEVAVYYFGHMFRNLTFQGAAIGFNTAEFAAMFFVILVVEVFHAIQRHGSIRHMLREKPLLVRWALYHVLVFGILIGMYKTLQFIYFQF